MAAASKSADPLSTGPLAVGGLPTSHSGTQEKSYATALATKLSVDLSQPLLNSPTSTPSLGLHKGLPSISFEDSHIQNLSAPFGNSVIGKFAQGFNKINPKLGRPSAEDIHLHLLSMDFKDAFTVGLLDNRHVWIRFSNEEDFHRLYSRPVWHIGGKPMRIFKWTPHFQHEIESSLVPIWVKFPRLPLQFFHKSALFPIASLIGLPLRPDSATISLKRPSVARIQIEIDLLKPRIEKIWIKVGSSGGYWQMVEYESIPPYCTHCMHVGHSETLCTVHNPELASCDKKQPRQWVKKMQDTSNKAATVSQFQQAVSATPVLTESVQRLKETRAQRNSATTEDTQPLVSADEDKGQADVALTSQADVPEVAMAAMDQSSMLPVERNENKGKAVIVESSLTPDVTKASSSLSLIPVLSHGAAIEPQLVSQEIGFGPQPISINTAAPKTTTVIELGTTADLSLIPVLSRELQEYSEICGDETPSDATPLPTQDFLTGIYARQKIPLLRRSASTIGLIQSYKEDALCGRSCLNLDNESELEDDYSTESHEEIIVMDQMGRLRLQLQPVTPVVTNPGKASSPAASSKTQSKNSPVPSAPSPTASSGEDEILALASLSAPAIVNSVTDFSSTAKLQDDPSFQQPKNRGRKKKSQENTQEKTSRSRSTARASFNILSEE